MVAGALAGVSEHCVMFPMDTVKTRMQVAGSAETSLVGTARSVVP
jgi:solute carrier family 25 iron transporter 28/37